jgi:hypothetical protein
MLKFRAVEKILDDMQPPVPDGAHAEAVRPLRPDLLMVGGTGRNSGKTELVCRLIGRFAGSTPVVGLKVTSVDRTDGSCPHNGEGCGVCSSLTRPWIVTREMNRESPKDTCRMLASGAHRVYWLRALRSELADGVADLLTNVPAGWPTVCESTSLRQVVEPGLFLMVRGAHSNGAKPSARVVAHLADRVVVSDGRSFDLDLDRISVVGGHWVLRREACAVVVVGDEGRSEADRAAALQRTRASLEPQFDRVLVASGGLAQGLDRLSSPEPSGPHEAWCLVAPPLADGVPPALVNALFRRRSGVDVVVAATRAGRREVCLALCRRPLLPRVIAAHAAGARSVGALGDRLRLRALQWGAAGSTTGPEQVPVTLRGTAAEAL